MLKNDKSTQLELTVRNHAGVMSHVCGLFARRAYNMEGILCMPINGGANSRIWLLVNEQEKLDQIIKQCEKLEDVLEVVCRAEVSPEFDMVKQKLGEQREC